MKWEMSKMDDAALREQEIETEVFLRKRCE
jgi:hypothetical protein